MIIKASTLVRPKRSWFLCLIKLISILRQVLRYTLVKEKHENNVLNNNDQCKVIHIVKYITFINCLLNTCKSFWLRLRAKCMMRTKERWKKKENWYSVQNPESFFFFSFNLLGDFALKFHNCIFSYELCEMLLFGANYRLYHDATYESWHMQFKNEQVYINALTTILYT